MITRQPISYRFFWIFCCYCFLFQAMAFGSVGIVELYQPAENDHEITSQEKNIQFISLGGWCGVAIGLRGCDLYEEAYPFDYVRSTFEGVIDCFETDFQNFFPKTIKVDNNAYHSIRGKYVGFYYHNVEEREVREAFLRRIDRLTRVLSTTTDEVYFIRTTVLDDFSEEIALHDRFVSVMKDKFPALHYKIVYIIPNQKTTGFYDYFGSYGLIFTLNDPAPWPREPLIEAHRPIFTFLKERRVGFPSDIAIEKSSKLWLVDGMCMIDETN